jgi:prepilin-type N-terminal cleavage/methylation domain-containing protein
MLGLGEKRNFKNNKGFTIIELAIVMAIIGIMALFMSPPLGEWVAGFRMRGATKDLADTLQLARLKAISTGNQYRVQLNINAGDVAETFELQPGPTWTPPDSTITLPKGVNIDRIGIDPGAIQAGNINFTFDTDGTITGLGGTTSIIYVTNQRNDQYRVIVSQTGMVRMRDGW